MRTWRAYLAWCLGLGTALLATACASRPASTIDAPQDFALSVTLLDPNADTGRSNSGWFVVEPDGRLRASLGWRRADTPLPRVVRQLSPAEIDDLWHLTSASGLAGPESRRSRPGERDVPPENLLTSTALVYVAANGTRRSYHLDLHDADAPTQGARALAERLFELTGLDSSY